MSTLEQISLPVLPMMEQFRQTCAQALQNENALLTQVVLHVQASSGKQMRPLLVMLSAALLGGGSDSSYHAATAVELLHVASLMHDDVVDESAMRRGKPSVMAQFGNKVAVLGGDYFLSTSLSESVLTGRLDAVAVISELGQTLANGELLQLDCALRRNFSEEVYFSVIHCKTAALFEACARLGAMTSLGGTDEDANRLALFGERLGRCFQIKDDLLDYASAEEVGKPTGNDIREGKFTLPLIHVYEQADEAKRNEMLRLLEEADVERLQEMARRDGGIRYATQCLERLKAEAEACLSVYPDSPVKSSLLLYLDYVSSRSY
ncbi:MAG: polyprenyl synthetase family protein [Paludibacteraceae bacterium]|nr:polyprenyl synthetase family protein [Paludibacteraceae bacterium]